MVIAFVGAGGKTTQIHKLTDELLREGKKVLVCTTTHMMAEENTILTEDAEEIICALHKQGYAMAGVQEIKDGKPTGKITALPSKTYEKVAEAADVVLVEADGSARKPVKYPEEWEPVIPENTDQIRIVMGLKAIGKTIGEAAHRKELVCNCLSAHFGHAIEEDYILGLEDLLVLAREGYKKKLAEKYPAVDIILSPGQADTLYERVQAAFLREEILPEGISPLWFNSQPELIILGGGYVSQAVAKMAAQLDFRITVIDDREAFANKEVFPDADAVYCIPFSEAVKVFPEGKDKYFVVVTRGHAADEECVSQILSSEYIYLGMIGSRKKVAVTKETLFKKGFTAEQIETIHAPIGLPIGAETPAEIAVSILAQIIECRHTYGSGSLSKELIQCKKSGTLCIILEKTGSSPRKPGSMMLVSEKEVIGTIGGGALEHEVIAHALQVRKIETEEYVLDKEKSAELGMVCGGINKILFIPV